MSKPKSADRYKVIYKHYDFSRFITRSKSDEAGYYGEQLTTEWNNALNAYAEHGMKVKESGAFNSGRDVIFWALLEKE
jgi:hypothetical protein